MFTTGSNAPEDIKVSMMIRVPWRAREELRALAEERSQSLNSLLTESLESATGVVMT